MATNNFVKLLPPKSPVLKRTLILLSICLIGCLSAKAQTSELFSYNKQAAENELSSLTQLEKLVKSTNENYNELAARNGFASLNLKPDNVKNTSEFSFDFESIHWGSFAWGFCCFPIGCVLMVFDPDKSEEQLRSFILGVGVSTACNTFSYYAYFLALGY
ncbi:MAG: hypothetical protein KDC92_05340 [Bacteroidetes bacterium]|nr:hypothetical protein [Bacteroidota bacterium]